VVIASFVLLPITLYYFSPVLSLSAAASGIVSGSVMVFALLFVSALSAGRVFCGWACPAGGAQEVIALVRRKPVNRRRINWIKWLVWSPWLIMLVFFILRAGGARGFDFFYQTRGGISVTDIPGAIAYIAVVAIFLILSATVGKRAGCHTICWMAPFMVIGRSIRNVFAWPSLRLAVRPDACAGCGKCGKECPMSIDVTERVKADRIESRDCILCGSCVDACPRGAIRYSFSSGR
jgi:polyferredoxin